MRRRLIVLFVVSVLAAISHYETNADELTGNEASNLSFYYAITFLHGFSIYILML